MRKAILYSLAFLAACSGSAPSASDRGSCQTVNHFARGKSVSQLSDQEVADLRSALATADNADLRSAGEDLALQTQSHPNSTLAVTKAYEICQELKIHEGTAEDSERIQYCLDQLEQTGRDVCRERGSSTISPTLPMTVRGVRDIPVPPNLVRDWDYDDDTRVGELSLTRGNWVENIVPRTVRFYKSFLREEGWTVLDDKTDDERPGADDDVSVYMIWKKGHRYIRLFLYNIGQSTLRLWIEVCPPLDKNDDCEIDKI